MFWGLIMEPRKRYSQTVEKPFHISMAALDISSKDDNEPTQIMATVDERNYLLCTLQKDKLVQCPLDLGFGIGEEVSFATNGKSHVHLTGYLTDDFFEDDEAEEEEEDDEDSEIPELNIGSKRKAITSLGESKKKLKASALLEESLNSDDESDDSDVNSDILNDTEDNELEEEEDSDDDDDAEEEEDDEDDDDESGEDSDEVFSKIVNSKGQQNGVASLKTEKKTKKEIKQEQNGSAKKLKKEVKPEVSSPKSAKQEKTPKKEKQLQTEPTPKAEKTPKSEKKQKDKTPAQNKTPAPAASPQKKTIEGGVIIEDIKVGNGSVAKSGKMLQVYYEGRLKQNNKMFDSTTSGKGFRFRLGQQEVIKGLDVGFNGMKVGGKRRIIIPPNMGYGNKGSPPTIPANSTLVFEVELKNVN